MSVPIGVEPDDGHHDTVPDQKGLESLDRGLCQSKRVDSCTEMSGSKALHTAAKLGKTKIMKEIIKNGFDVNNNIEERTPLREATENAQFGAIQLLL
ncbi:hypothetical protein MRS44_011494 [Fusarium solani]|uniref:uncharacterized protein n=1 Tax=Fusarium solani TaxID=169388 RepID=UPI0032C3FA1F|nr:hypothetical protein MRS44_011494 [Fusarium solani]